MSTDHRDLDSTEEWFRTKLHDTIHYGIAAITIIAGWLLSSDSIISIHHAEDAEKKEAAIVLAILLPLAWGVWFTMLRRLHAHLPPHPTIVSKKNLHLLAIGMLLLFVVIWCVVADVITIPAQFTLKK
ncbi:MAG: hypothetical protein HS117_08955 [Verrucomicrobiaceae bacterium]|jgi:hypothetical protein|nr:hypothetical protein [Verrucomicrobiaceae bacterium]